MRIGVLNKRVKHVVDEAVVVEGDLPKLKMDKVDTWLGHSDWVIVDGFVIDISAFLHVHPGSAYVLEGLRGRDVSTLMREGRYAHGVNAFGMARDMRVALAVK
jgi:hypothetical protein